jgi:signal peptidase I
MPRFSRRRSLSANTLQKTLQPRPRAARPAYALIGDFVKTALYALIAFSILSTLIARFEIEQTSMEPNFHPGQRVIVSQVGRALGSLAGGAAYAARSGALSPAGLQRGQVVVFYETADQSASPLIKRLIGLPGDHVAIHDGVVFIDGTALVEPYLQVSTACTRYCDLTLGADEYFFLGDNRPVSRDSRVFGPVIGERVVGRVVARFWPLSAWQIFP